MSTSTPTDTVRVVLFSPNNSSAVTLEVPVEKAEHTVERLRNLNDSILNLEVYCYIRAGKEKEGRGREEVKDEWGLSAYTRGTQGGKTTRAARTRRLVETDSQQDQGGTWPGRGKAGRRRSRDRRKVGQGYKEPDEFGRGYERRLNTRPRVVVKRRSPDEREMSGRRSRQ
ncbi:hypothetical protein R3P38DRAFT_2816430 [Favolaschia claudopus]|uniref:Uncharacterized protein n=1 Tax=Favolaschia claudopus TaxID=2862362 RepID=A0AAV9Z0L1_9AGAR